MRPLFTIHGGEYLVGSHIEQHFKRVNVWLPSRDTGVDLLVSDSKARRTISLQVKFSKDYLIHMEPAFQKDIRAFGWWTINQKKLADSTADFWAFVLLGFERRTTDYVVVPRLELGRRLRSIHGSQKIIQSYLCITERNQCWEARGIKRSDRLQIAYGDYRNEKRDFTKWLNNWTSVQKLDGSSR